MPSTILKWLYFFQPVSHSCHLWFHLSAVMIASWTAWIMSAACKHAHSHTRKAGYLIYIYLSHTMWPAQTLSWHDVTAFHYRPGTQKYSTHTIISFQLQNHLPRWDVVSYQTHRSCSKCDLNSTHMGRCVSCRNGEHWVSEKDRQTDREKYAVLRGRSNSSEAQTSAWGEEGALPFLPQ